MTRSKSMFTPLLYKEAFAACGYTVVKTVELDQLRERAEKAELLHKDLEQSITEMCNDLWGLLYPDDPTGWEYRTQPIAHIRVELEQLRERTARLEAALRGQRLFLYECYRRAAVSPNGLNIRAEIFDDMLALADEALEGGDG